MRWAMHSCARMLPIDAGSPSSCPGVISGPAAAGLETVVAEDMWLTPSVLVLQDKGVALHLRKAALQWTSDAPSSTLWSKLLLHDVSLTPGVW